MSLRSACDPLKTACDPLRSACDLPTYPPAIPLRSYAIPLCSIPPHPYAGCTPALGRRAHAGMHPSREGKQQDCHSKGRVRIQGDRLEGPHQPQHTYNVEASAPAGLIMPAKCNGYIELCRLWAACRHASIGSKHGDCRLPCASRSALGWACTPHNPLQETKRAANAICLMVSGKGFTRALLQLSTGKMRERSGHSKPGERLPRDLPPYWAAAEIPGRGGGTPEFWRSLKNRPPHPISRSCSKTLLPLCHTRLAVEFLAALPEKDRGLFGTATGGPAGLLDLFFRLGALRVRPRAKNRSVSLPTPSGATVGGAENP